MIRAALVLGALVIVLPAAARPQEDESKALRAKLRSIRLDVDFANYTVTQLADYLRDAAGINIVVDPTLGEIRTPLAMKARNVTVHSILALLLKPHQVGFVVEDGVLKIAPESRLKSDIRLEIIDVRDVMFPIRDFPGVDLSLANDDAGVAFSAVADDAPAEFPLVDLVKAHTGGKAWEENVKTSIQLSNGLLFVRHTPEVIAQVRKVVGFLRRYK